MQRIENWLPGWIIQHRWWIIAATLLMVTCAAAGGRFLYFTNDSRIFFSKENPQLIALETLENTFTKDDNILFAIAPKDGNVFSRKTLAAIIELTEAGWQIPYSSRVASITNFQHTWTDGNDLIVEDLVQDPEMLTDDALADIREIAMNEPLLTNRLLASSGKVTGVNVNIILPGISMNESPEAAAYAREMVQAFRAKHPDIEIYLTGGTMIDVAFGEASENDMTTLVPLMFVVLLVIIGVTLRSVTGTLATFLIILFSTLTAMGVAGWFRLGLTSASVSAPTIIMTLAVADSIHLLVTILDTMRKGLPKKEAVTESLRINLQPVFITSLTTTIGFLSMNFSDAPPFRDLGNIVAVGVSAAFFFSIFFLPSLIAVLPIRVKVKVDEAVCPSCDRLVNFVVKYRRALFWSLSALCLIVVTGTLRIDLDDDFIRYFDERYEFRRASDFVEDNLSGMHIIEYTLHSGKENGINDPQYLLTTDRFVNWYRQQPQVANVSAITDIIKRLNMNMHQNDRAFYRIPDQQELVAQYLLLYEMSLPFGFDLNNQINVNRSATRMRVLMSNVTSKELRQMDERARQWLRDNASPNMFTYGTGLSIVFAHISERNIKSMLGASIGALILISGILIFAFKSLRFGFLSLVPNLAPAFIAFGLWGFFIGRVGMALAVIVAMTLGIVVDDTIHFISKYLRGRREHGKSPAESVHYAFNMVGTALWVTSLALVAGFGVLSFSGFKVNSEMGLMAAITISAALALDFFYLPTLNMKLEKKDEIVAFSPDSCTIPATANCDEPIR